MAPAPLDVVFRPSSIAVVGASRNPQKVGYQILHNLLTFGFQGPIYPVNAAAKEVHSIRAYPDLLSIPDPVDLVVIVVPARHVLEIMEQAGKKGARGAVIITAGFAEIGGDGLALEQKLQESAIRNRIRLIGPNCMGIITTDPAVQMNATFAPTQPMPGRIAFMSQSGALCAAILSHARHEGIGFSYFVSMGNKTNISGNDLLEEWGRDPGTDVVLMYIENFGNPRKFTVIAKDVTTRKPIIAVKSGRTEAGARAATSHTGSIAGADFAAEALMKQCGVLRAASIEELFDCAVAFANQPLPSGRRLVVLTNAGGPGIMTADAAVGAGLQVAPLPEATKNALRAQLPKEAAVQNPVDMIASATPEQYLACGRILMNDPAVDALMAIWVPVVVEREMEVAAAITTLAAEAKAAGNRKPVLACFLGEKETSPGVQHLVAGGIPTYRYPESAVRALSAMVRYQSWLRKDKGKVPSLAVDRDRVRTILAGARTAGRLQLSYDESREVLAAYGIPFGASVLASDVEGALAAAERVRYPLVLKIDSPDALHKSEFGGVKVGIRDESELVRAFQDLKKRFKEKAPDGRLNGIRVEEMVQGGKETIVGMSLDRKFGPIIMFGLGGTYVEYVKDVAFRLTPLSDTDAREMIEEIRGYPILRGVRGEPASDVTSLVDLLLRVGALVADFIEIQELDLNPVMVLPEGKGYRAVDARLRIA